MTNTKVPLSKITKNVTEIKNQAEQITKEAAKKVSTLKGVIQKASGAINKKGINQGIDTATKGIELAAKGARLASKGAETLASTMEKASKTIKKLNK